MLIFLFYFYNKTKHTGSKTAHFQQRKKLTRQMEINSLLQLQEQNTTSLHWNQTLKTNGCTKSKGYIKYIHQIGIRLLLHKHKISCSMTKQCFSSLWPVFKVHVNFRSCKLLQGSKSIVSMKIGPWQSRVKTIRGRQFYAWHSSPWHCCTRQFTWRRGLVNVTRRQLNLLASDTTETSLSKDHTTKG